MRYRFSGFVLDLARVELRHRDEPIVLRRKVFDVLRLLVESAPKAVSKQDLLDAAWPGVSTGDDSLTQAVSQARRALAEAEPDTEVIRTLRGHGYVMAVPVLPLDGLSKDAPASGSEAFPAVGKPARSRARRVRRGVLAALAVLLVVVGLLARDPGFPAPAVALPDLAASPAVLGPDASVAVLPFQDLSAGGAYRYLAEGLAEELTDELARIPGLHVVPRTSVQALREPGSDIETLGTRLGVGSMVEGSVRVDEDRLRVTAQLVRTSDGFHVASLTFDRQLDALFDVQDELAESVASALSRSLVRIRPRERDVSVEAKLLFYRATSGIRNLRPDSLRAAITELERAVELEPDWAEAWSALASAHSLLWTAVLRSAPRTDEHLAAAERATERALALAPDAAHSQRSLGRIRLYAHRDWAGARAAMERALELSPDVSSLLNYAVLLAKAGRLDQALPYALQALAQEPMRPASVRTLARIQLYRGEYHESIALLHRLRELNPHDTDLPSLLSKAYAGLGREAESREAILLWFPESIRPAVRVLARTLGTVRTLRLFTELDNRSNGTRCGSVAWTSAHIYALTGEVDRMLECLEIASDRSLFFIVSEPYFDPYRSDPRFQDLMARTGYDEATLRAAFP